MAFIKKEKGHYYLVEKVKVETRWKIRRLRKATEKEIVAYQASRDNVDLAVVSCANPECDNTILIPRAQKRNFYIVYPQRYGSLRLPFCCKSCQEQYNKQLNQAQGKEEGN